MITQVQAQLNQNGQVVIPAKFRNIFGIIPKETTLSIMIQDEGIMIRPVKEKNNKAQIIKFPFKKNKTSDLGPFIKTPGSYANDIDQILYS